MQRDIYDFTRARAGPYAKRLLREPDFHAAVEVSRWRAYPLGLAMVAEMVEGVLRPHAGTSGATFSTFSALVLAVFDRYPVPAALGSDDGERARNLRASSQLIGLHPPKRVIDIPEQ